MSEPSQPKRTAQTAGRQRDLKPSPAPARLPFQFTSVDPTIRREIVYHHASDGYPLSGVLYLPPHGDADLAVLAMHPRGDFSRHYLAPPTALGGFAFFGATSRYLHNDADALHERLLLDVAGSITWLKRRGFKRVVLLGNSGGCSLFSYYLEQAAKAGPVRHQTAPSGDRVPLGDFDLPLADGFFALAAHPGEGAFLLERLDPSLVDEADPVSANPRLDMYDPKNGYVPMQLGPSSYSADFLAEFRAAQIARCERLDARAKSWIAEAQAHKRTLNSGEHFAGLEAREKLRVARHSLVRRYMLIYRTLADPRYLDPKLDPSQRPLGSIFSFGRDPIAGNYGEGLARSMSARGWLSTWSGLTSRANVLKNLPGVSCPFHLCNALADMDIYPSEADAMFNVVGSRDKTRSELAWADHYLNPQGEAGGKLRDPRQRCADEVFLPWLRERWASDAA